MPMYDIPTDGCNLEIMGYPFFAESVSPTEAFRRRNYNFNNIVGGTQKVTPADYVGLEFSVTTHVFIDPERPDEHNSIFQEMMSKPVEVISPELGGSFNAIVVVKPTHEKLDYLKLDISIKEVPDSQSKIPGEEFTVPATRVVETEKKEEEDKSKENTNAKDNQSKNMSKISSFSNSNKRNAIMKKFLGS